MKRVALVVALGLVLALLSGCAAVSLLAGARAALGANPAAATAVPDMTEQAVQLTATPEETTMPEETAAHTMDPTATPESAVAANPNDYTSEALGITMTMPESWAGKYRVAEYDGSFTVCFKPEEPIEDGMGVFFSIVKKTAEDDGSFLDEAVEFKIGDTTYIYGLPTDVTYFEDSPEYSTYQNMRQDMPGILRSVRAAG